MVDGSAGVGGVGDVLYCTAVHKPSKVLDQLIELRALDLKPPLEMNCEEMKRIELKSRLGFG